MYQAGVFRRRYPQFRSHAACPRFSEALEYVTTRCHAFAHGPPDGTPQCVRPHEDLRDRTVPSSFHSEVELHLDIESTRRLEFLRQPAVATKLTAAFMAFHRDSRFRRERQRFGLSRASCAYVGFEGNQVHNTGSARCYHSNTA